MGKRNSKGAQKNKSKRILVACAVMTCALFCRAAANNKTNNFQIDSDLKVYLPREVTVKNSSLSLGQVSIIRGSDSLVAKASKIAMGRISVPGQKIVIDRPMVLSRLACDGIPASKVTLIGAEKITVKQQHKTISGNEFVTLASSFLENNISSTSACRWSPMRKPKDFFIPDSSKDITFSSRIVQNNVRNQSKVEVTVLSGGEKIGIREVGFSLKYNCRQTVTKADIPAGGIISPENTKIENNLSNYPEPVDWKPPYGLIAKRRLPTNTVLRSNMVSSVKSQIIVKRNQNVVIRIEKPGFLITAMGKTMQDGRAGEYIKVRNVDSQRIIQARINEDGSVEPVL